MFRSEFEFVRLVEGKNDHQYDLTLLPSSNGQKVITQQTQAPKVFLTLDQFDKFDWTSKMKKN